MIHFVNIYIVLFSSSFSLRLFTYFLYKKNYKKLEYFAFGARVYSMCFLFCVRACIFSVCSFTKIIYKKNTLRVIVCPRSVDVNDLQGNPHTLQVQVLGTEETWNTPSLMLASDIKNGGKALFSQVFTEKLHNWYIISLI